MKKLSYLFLLIILASCQTPQPTETDYSGNILDFTADPENAYDRRPLAFSDQGAWFAYGLPEKKQNIIGFSGPFLITEQNGVWSSPSLTQTKVELNGRPIDLSGFSYAANSCASHLEQIFENEILKIEQKLFYNSPHQAHIQTTITNLSEELQEIKISYAGHHFVNGLRFIKNEKGIKIESENSSALGNILFDNKGFSIAQMSDSNYQTNTQNYSLKTNHSEKFIYSQQFLFPDHEKAVTGEIELQNFDEALGARVKEKQEQLKSIFSQMAPEFQKTEYKELAAKCYLTLQNNWRIAAGELKHDGLFPSYHYKWFHGFWAWDSWKHAVALARFNPGLAKDQIRAMYDYMDSTGFIADCIYRDTSIENHNYRNTKPPLSAWAVWEVFIRTDDIPFLKEMYPKIIRQHEWWYQSRDHDQDGLCEYGSTDGSLIAAKWESGMDNAVRFDDSQILQNSETAWSLDQESVDLNAYLYAEKICLSKIANELGKHDEGEYHRKSAETLVKQMDQFYDPDKGWYFDTELNGNNKIDVMGCEGWIPLWAECVIDDNNAEHIKNNILKEEYFNTKVPLQTLSAGHLKFKPDGGYWRGPVWLDQSYFGIIGLKNYGYHTEALELTKKLIHNADGVLGKGKSIRENYQPITGEGLESENFSWSAAHYLLLMMDENQ